MNGNTGFHTYYRFWGSVMPNLNSTLAPNSFFAPETPPEVRLLAEVPIQPIGSGDIDATFQYLGNISSYTPSQMMEYCLERARHYLDHDDPMQASEKLYKATEEAIKFLAKRYSLKEAETAEQKGKWSVGLLGTASKALTANLKMDMINEAWVQAFDIHVLGFHENKYGVKEIELAVPYVKKLVAYVKGVSDGRRKQRS